MTLNGKWLSNIDQFARIVGARWVHWLLPIRQRQSQTFVAPTGIPIFQFLKSRIRWIVGSVGCIVKSVTCILQNDQLYWASGSYLISYRSAVQYKCPMWRMQMTEIAMQSTKTKIQVIRDFRNCKIGSPSSACDRHCLDSLLGTNECHHLTTMISPT